MNLLANFFSFSFLSFSSFLISSASFSSFSFFFAFFSFFSSFFSFFAFLAFFFSFFSFFDFFEAFLSSAPSSFESAVSKFSLISPSSSELNSVTFKFNLELTFKFPKTASFDSDFGKTPTFLSPPFTMIFIPLPRDGSELKPPFISNKPVFKPTADPKLPELLLLFNITLLAGGLLPRFLSENFTVGIGSPALFVTGNSVFLV